MHLPSGLQFFSVDAAAANLPVFEEKKRFIQIHRAGIYNAFSFTNGFLNGNCTDLYGFLFKAPNQGKVGFRGLVREINYDVVRF